MRLEDILMFLFLTVMSVVLSAIITWGACSMSWERYLCREGYATYITNASGNPEWKMIPIVELNKPTVTEKD